MLLKKTNNNIKANPDKELEMDVSCNQESENEESEDEEGNNKEGNEGYARSGQFGGPKDLWRFTMKTKQLDEWREWLDDWEKSNPFRFGLLTYFISTKPETIYNNN